MTTLIGDSISVGVGPRLQKIDPSVRLIAIGGKRLSWMAEQEPQTDAGELVLLMGGTNDLAGAEAVIAFEALKKTVATLSKRGQRVIVSTVPNLGPFPQRTDAYNAMIRVSGLSQADIGGKLPSGMMSADGIHPNFSGQQWIAERWAEVIKGNLVQNRVEIKETSPGGIILGIVGIGLAYTAFRR